MNDYILIVEDEVIIAKDIETKLSQIGYMKYQHAITGEQALDMVSEDLPILVLMDISLPGKLDGIQTATQITSSYKIPIVYVTSYSSSMVMQRALKSEPYGYIMKPFDRRELEIAISIALYKYQMEKKQKEIAHTLKMQMKRQKKLIHAIRKSRVKYRSIFKCIQDVYFETAIDGTVLEMSPSVKHHSHYIRSELIGRPITEIYYYPEERQRFLDTLRAEHSVINYEVDIRDKNGEIIHLSMDARLVSMDNNGSLKIVGSLSDITKRKKLEAQLTQSINHFRNIFENASVGLFCIRFIDGKFVYWNKPFESILGFDESEIKQSDWGGLCAQIPDIPDSIRFIQARAEHQKNIKNESLRIVHKSKKEINVLLSAKYSDTDQTIEGTLIDITTLDHWFKKKFEEQENRIKLLEKSILELHDDKNNFSNIISKNPKMHAVFQVIKEVAPFDIPVLITGETGTGKELIAHAIHRNSLRSEKPFVPINCGAIPENLIEGELFGYEAGAFTGAVKKRIGLFEYAEGGTIFLDEIADLNYSLQVKLLRVLQEKEITRLGGNQTIKVDVRILCATNKNLTMMVAKNQFREDLFYRINVVFLSIPPLRERIEDIPLLIMYFINKYNTLFNKKVTYITEPVLSILMQKKWQGNVRELENVIERCVILSKSDHLEYYEPVSKLSSDSSRVESSSKAFLSEISNLSLRDQMTVLEKHILQKAIKDYAGDLPKVAKELRIGLRTLYRKISTYHIEY